jgi:hypothetical protein
MCWLIWRAGSAAGSDKGRLIVSEYAKALVGVVLGLALVIAGALVPDETLRTLGYGALGASPLVAVVPNRKSGGE